jgi:hypothetical protein
MRWRVDGVSVETMLAVLTRESRRCPDKDR